MSDVKVKFGAEDVGLEKTLKSVQAELGDLKDKVKSGDLSMSELESTMKRVGQIESLEKRLKGMGGEAAETAPKIDKLGDEAKTMGKKAEDAGEQGGIGLGKIGAAAGVAGVAFAAGMKVMELAAAATRAVIDSFGEALELGGRLTDFSERTGETAGNLLVLERAFENTGVGADKVGATINRLQKFMDAATDSSSKQAGIMDRLGISMQDLEGKTPVEQMQVFADKINSIQDPTQRAAVAMSIFGKSGGELLPLLRNFGGEVENANTELGSMVDIMNQNSSVFDTVGDKFTIIKGKLTELAAGIINQALPAFELFTTAFARFDAAGFGKRLADAFIGGREAMNGFTAALDAIKAGNLSMAFEIAMKSISIQLQNTANEVWKRLVASFEAAGEFLVDIFGPGSSIYTIIKKSFSVMADELSVSFLKSMKAIMEVIPGIGDDIAQNIDRNIKQLQVGIKNSENQITNSMQVIGEDFKFAARQFPEEFEKAYNTTKPIFNVQKDVGELTTLMQKAAQEKLIGEEAKKNAEDLSGSLQEMKASLEPLPPIFTDGSITSDRFSAAMKNLGASMNGVPNDKSIKVDMQGTETVEEKIKKLSNEVNGVKDQKFITVAMEIGGYDEFAKLQKDLEFFPNSKSIKMILEQTGLNIDELREKINLVPNTKNVELFMKANGIESVDEARRILNSLVNKRVEAAVEATGVESIEELSAKLRGIPDPDDIRIAIEQTGAENVEEAITKLDTISTQKRQLVLEATGMKSIDELQAALKGIKPDNIVKIAVEAAGLKTADELLKAIDAYNGKGINMTIDANAESAKQAIDGLEGQIDAISNNIVTLDFTDDGALSQLAGSVPGYFQEPITLDMSADGALSQIAGSLPGYFTDPITLAFNGEGDLSSISSSVDGYFSDTINLDMSADGSIGTIESNIAQLGSEAVNLNLNAGDSINTIKSQLKEQIDLSLSSSQGTNILEGIKGFVDKINSAVTEISKKLPQTALAN